MKSVLLSLAVVLLVAGTAHAEDKALAEKYFRAGAKAFAAQNFQAAAANFDEAFKALPMPEIAFSAAQAFRKLYQVEPTLEHASRSVELYEFYLSKVKTGGRVSDAADNLTEMKRERDKLVAAGAKATAVAEKPQTRLVVNVGVADQASTADSGTLGEIGDVGNDAAIKGLVATIDGQKVEPFTPTTVEPKEHVIAVAADGYFSVEKKTVAVDGASTMVDVELKPKPAKIAVTTESDAKILIDGRAVATAPSAPVEIPQGKHLLAVLRSGREPFAQELTVTRGQELEVDADLRKTARRKAVPWVYGGAGVLAAGALATALFAHSRNSHAEDLQMQIDMGNQPVSVADDLDRTVRSRDKLVTWTWILGGAAVAAGATGTLLLVFDTPTAESATVGVSGHF
ncbi:MAG TPA: PEGA domain-containing protein [Kofleriaceae bacterium]|nr:PEGA domain-containing protein [Kofleriaceae bacterium]